MNKLIIFIEVVMLTCVSFIMFQLGAAQQRSDGVECQPAPEYAYQTALSSLTEAICKKDPQFVFESITVNVECQGNWRDGELRYGGFVMGLNDSGEWICKY